MKKLAAAFLILPLAAYSGYDKDSSGFKNTEHKKEYQYKIYPNLTFWNEGGRPYWKGDNESFSYHYPRPITINEVVIFGNSDLNKNLETFNEKVYFKHNSAKLTRQGRETLEDLANQIEDTKVQKISIHGFASEPGTKSYNKELSEDRADAVASYLSALGVEENRMDIKAHGETKLMKTEKKSRRAKLNIKTKETYSE
jgi:outer membrane protein OmpA-like peptidoglycan-associated protein